MRGVCRLFDIETDLRHSHIHPKFAIEHFIKTGSKYMRSYTEPNRRKQDGSKRFLLSEKAEQRFSKSERWFSENIFKPYLLEKKSTFTYNEDLFYFAISYLWRYLTIEIEEKLNGNEDYFEVLFQAEKEWKLFLSNYQYPRNYNNCFLMFTDRVKSHDLNVKGVDYYFSRMLDATFFFNEDNSYVGVYAKFLRFIFWSELKSPSPSLNISMRINPTGGEMAIPQNLEDDLFGNFLLNRVQQVSEFPELSEKQQMKVYEEIMKNQVSFFESDAFEAMKNDFENLDPNT